MSIKVKCTNPSCARECEFEDGLAGRLVKCPACGTVLSLPVLNALGSALGAAEAPRSQPLVSAAPPETLGLAIASLVLGIIGLLSSCIAVGGVLAIIALILGILALSKISRQPRTYKGKGMALAGTIMGAVGIVIALISLILILASFRIAAEFLKDPETKVAVDLSRINGALLQYKSKFGKLPESLDELPREVFVKVPLVGAVNPSDFEYVGAKLTEEELQQPRRLLIYLKKPLETGEHPVLLVGGTTLILSEEEFKAAVAGEPVPDNAGRIIVPMMPGSHPLREELLRRKHPQV